MRYTTPHKQQTSHYAQRVKIFYCITPYLQTCTVQGSSSHTTVTPGLCQCKLQAPSTTRHSLIFQALHSHSAIKSQAALTYTPCHSLVPVFALTWAGNPPFLLCTSLHQSGSSPAKTAAAAKKFTHPDQNYNSLPVYKGQILFHGHLQSTSCLQVYEP